MLETRRLTATLAVTLLTTAAGCASNISPPPASDTAAPKVNSLKDGITEPVISATKITLAAISSNPGEQLKINQYLSGLAVKG
ncbi:MAG TPA: hypothetical protein VIQ31_23770, partial [Phormidium sp.]